MLGYLALWALGEALCQDDQDNFGRKTRRNDCLDNCSIFDDDDIYESYRFGKREYWDDEYDEDECDDPEDLEDY